MGALLDLPPELITLVIDNLHGDGAALRACALVSRVFLPQSQAHLFEHIMLGGRRIFPGSTWIALKNVEATRKYIPSDPDGPLSYTRNLSIFLGVLTRPQDLEGIYDHLLAFKNVRELQARLFATNYVRGGLALFSRYFSHFQSTLRCLHLETPLKNPKDLITFIASFPLLEDVSIEALRDSPILPPLLDNESKGFDPDLLSPLKGSLRLYRLRRSDDFATELARVRVQYHALSICDVTAWTGVRELIIACAPTLRTLNITRESCKLLSLRF
jgi:hypothetical protein